MNYVDKKLLKDIENYLNNINSLLYMAECRDIKDSSTEILNGFDNVVIQKMLNNIEIISNKLSKSVRKCLNGSN